MAGAVLAFRLPSLLEPQWYSDDGFFSAVAWASSKGVTLYAGIFDNSPPMIYWLYRLLFLFGGRANHAVVQVAAAVAVVTATMLTLEIGRRLGMTTRQVALAALLTGLALSLPTLDGDVVNVEVAALPFFLAALLLSRSSRAWGPFAAGALLAVALATRPSYALDGLAMAVPLLTAPDRVRRFLMTAAGGASVALLVALALAIEGSLPAYLNLVLPADRAYLIWANGGSSFPVLARLTVFGAISVAAFMRARTPAGRLLAIWLPASLAGASLTPRGFTHYGHEAIPPLALGIAMLASAIRPRLLGSAAAAVALLISVELLLFLPAQQNAAMEGTRAPDPFARAFPYRDLPAYYGNWFLYVTGIESREHYEASFPGFVHDSAEVRFIEAHGLDGDRVLVLGDRPWVYVRSGHLPAGRFLATNTAFWRVPTAPAELRRTLEQGCAAIVLYDSGPGDWHNSLRAGGYREVTGALPPAYLLDKDNAVSYCNG